MDNADLVWSMQRPKNFVCLFFPNDFFFNVFFHLHVVIFD